MNSKNTGTSIVLVSLSFLVSLLYSYLISHTERGLPLLDWFNITIHLVWFSVLAWVVWDIYRGKPYAKKTLLFLACVVGLLTGFDIFEKQGAWLLATISTLEALFLFAAYLLLPKIEASSEPTRL
jgi:uncharacterized membrane protein SirB2